MPGPQPHSPHPVPQLVRVPGRLRTKAPQRAERGFRLDRGGTFALYAAAYTVGRFWIEYGRVDEAHHILGLRLNGWTALLVLAVGNALIVVPGHAAGAPDGFDPLKPPSYVFLTALGVLAARSDGASSAGRSSRNHERLLRGFVPSVVVSLVPDFFHFGKGD